MAMGMADKRIPSMAKTYVLPTNIWCFLPLAEPMATAEAISANDPDKICMVKRMFMILTLVITFFYSESVNVPYDHNLINSQGITDLVSPALVDDAFGGQYF